MPSLDSFRAVVQQLFQTDVPSGMKENPMYFLTIARSALKVVHTVDGGHAQPELQQLLLMHAYAKRVLLTGSGSHERNGGIVPEWNIVSVLCGDGSTRKSNIRLMEGVVYVSGVQCGVPESFWEIESSSLRLCRQGVIILRWPVFAATVQVRRNASGALGPSVDMTGMLFARRSLPLSSACKPGYGGILASPFWSADPVQEAVFHYFKVIVCPEEDGSSGVFRLGAVSRALSFTSFGVFVGRALVESPWQNGWTILTRLRAAWQKIHSMPIPVEMTKVPSSGLKAFWKDPFAWLAEDAVEVRS